MSVETSKRYATNLFELVENLDATDDVARDRWLGKRSSPRYAYSTSAIVQVVTDNRIGPPVEYPLRDISEDGLCFLSKIFICPGTWLRVQVGTDEAIWSGNMRVTHCTETVGGFKVGANQSAALNKRKITDPSQEITSSIQLRLREMESLKTVAEDICKIVRAYDFARLSCGLLGTSLKKRITQIVTQLPPAPVQPVTQCRRKHPRKNMRKRVQFIIKTNYGRKRINARIINVSEGGGCLRIKNSVLDDPIEKEMAGELLIQPRMTLMLGIDESNGTLWVPTEIKRIQPVEENTSETEIGVAFVTDKSLAKLKKHI